MERVRATGKNTVKANRTEKEIIACSEDIESTQGKGCIIMLNTGVNRLNTRDGKNEIGQKWGKGSLTNNLVSRESKKTAVFSIQTGFMAERGYGIVR